MSLYDKNYFTEQLAAYRSAFMIFIVGLMFMIASLTSAIVYWNHNKIKQ